jgi:hypothetical protein
MASHVVRITNLDPIQDFTPALAALRIAGLKIVDTVDIY